VEALPGVVVLAQPVMALEREALPSGRWRARLGHKALNQVEVEAGRVLVFGEMPVVLGGLAAPLMPPHLLKVGGDGLYALVVHFLWPCVGGG
jgi:hypothetical protein